jgi:hypothetical protein
MITVSIDDFYRDGASTFILTREYYVKLKALIDAERWIENIGNTCDVTEWSLYSSLGEDKPLVPQKYIDIFTEMFSDPSVMGGLSNLYRVEPRFVDCWNGSEDLDWHWDGTDSFVRYRDPGDKNPRLCELFFLIYLTDATEWTEEMGGFLLYGERELKSVDTPDEVGSDELIASSIKKVYPKNRQVVAVNNMNPRFIHRTTKLNPVMPGDRVANRIVVQIGCAIYAAEGEGKAKY